MFACPDVQGCYPGLTPGGHEKDLIQAATEAVDKAVAHIFNGQEAVPSFGPTDLAALSPAEREVCSEHPERAAIHFCLTSSSALLEVSRLLLQEPADHSAAEQVSKIKKMSPTPRPQVVQPTGRR
jgi:hypothetical protein